MLYYYPFHNINHSLQYHCPPPWWAKRDAGSRELPKRTPCRRQNLLRRWLSSIVRVALTALVQLQKQPPLPLCLHKGASVHAQNNTLPETNKYKTTNIKLIGVQNKRSPAVKIGVSYSQINVFKVAGEGRKKLLVMLRSGPKEILRGL
jgi:hypothetical protein